MNDKADIALSQSVPLTGLVEYFYGTAGAVFYRNFALFAMIAVLLLATEALLLRNFGLSALLYMVIGLAAALPIAWVGHRTILCNEDFKPRDLMSQRIIPSRQFLRTSAPFLLLVATIYGLVTLALLADETSAQEGLAISLLLALLFTKVLNFYLLGRFGSALPAAAIGGDAGLSKAAARSRKRRWFIVQNILIGPVLFSWGIGKILSWLDAIGLQTTVRNAYGSLDITGAAIGYLLLLADIFAILLLVAALCQAYTSGEAILANKSADRPAS
ncbi:hypothetical protein ACJ5NV_14490 [Loktanella agnita]|uniref:hypothetical protein n=1 Tax=Loktanella agnita TaxID=287097 RepID=UPI00398721F4